MANEMRSVILKLYELWGKGDPEALPMLFKYLSDDIRWCSLADGCEGAEFTCECNGKEQVEGYFEGLLGEWEMLHYTIDNDVYDGDFMVMIGSCGYKNRKTGKSIDTPKVDILRIKDDKIVEFREFYDTAMLLAASK